MRSSRRAFLHTLGLAGAGTFAAPLLGRGHEALAATLRANPGVVPPELSAPAAAIRLSSNENPRGPAAAALDGIRAALGDSSRYAFDTPRQLRDAIAAKQGVKPEQVLVGCGSTELLKMSVDAYLDPRVSLVTAAPTFEEVAQGAELKGSRVHALPVDSSLKLDLDGMLAKAPGAGLIYVNNPNNPTGTIHSASTIADFVQRARRQAPGALILIDEAYHEYVEDPSYASALPIALAEKDVIVLRTFSKVYGLAGLRIGFAMGRPETLSRLSREQLSLSLNALGVAAALGALADDTVLPREKKLNREARDYTADAFTRAGYKVTPAHANFLMIDIRRDIRGFQEECRKRNVLVGRPFPPLATQARLSIGTMDEMRAAVPICLDVLGAAPARMTGGAGR